MKRPRRALLVPAALLVLAGAYAIITVGSTTRQGVNYRVSARTIPVYVKAIDFIDRHYQYRLLASEIVDGRSSDTDRVLAVFEWTRRNIRDTPPGFPVVDDHVWHIIVRGYGQADQKADVFTTLATYARVPAFWAHLGPTPPHLILSFVRTGGRWRVFDIEHGLVFRNQQGGLASAEELAADPSLVDRVAGGREYARRPYRSFFDGFRPPPPPPVLRAELQMVWPRLTHEMKSLVGLGPRESQQQ